MTEIRGDEGPPIRWLNPVGLEKEVSFEHFPYDTSLSLGSSKNCRDWQRVLECAICPAPGQGDTNARRETWRRWEIIYQCRWQSTKPTHHGSQAVRIDRLTIASRAGSIAVP